MIKYSPSVRSLLFISFFLCVWLAICTTCRKSHKEKLEGAKWLQSSSEDEPPIGESWNRYYIRMVKSRIFKQLIIFFFRVYTASSKPEEGWENSRQLSKPVKIEKFLMLL